MSTITYRPHIDGLRGLAIIAVVCYHAALFAMHGGYIGVDIFFVISGFLITSVIMHDLKEGTFTLAQFWEKRVRRIVPALTIVMCCTFVAGYLLILYPADLKSFGGAVAAQSVFISNMYFMTADSYFDAPSRYSPLLHTWTLSVEEQFYIFFPFIILGATWLFAGAKRKHALLSVIFCILVVSLWFDIWLVNIHPNARWSIPFLPSHIFADSANATLGFYFLPARAWELAVGAIIALLPLRITDKLLAEGLGWIGLTAMLAAIFLYSDKTSFPGIAALLPTFGAALFIIANEGRATSSAKILSYPALIGIGLISYSLYLWHWPIFVFARMLIHTPLAPSHMGALTILAGALAYTSFRWIERPIMRGKIITTRNGALVLGALSLALMLCAGLILRHVALATTERLTPGAKEIFAATNENAERDVMCMKLLEKGGPESGLCMVGQSTGAHPDFAVWGDSHADAQLPLFVALGWAYKKQGAIFAKGDCPPVLGVHQSPAVAGCESQNISALAYIRKHDIKHVFLVARWSNYVMEGDNKVRSAFLATTSERARTHDESRETLERELGSIVRTLAIEGREVYIVKQTPEQFDFITRDAFYRAAYTSDRIVLHGTQSTANDTYQSLANKSIDSLSAVSGVHIIDPKVMLCANGAECDLERDGKLLYRDENHLSIAGAMALEPLFTPIFLHMQ